METLKVSSVNHYLVKQESLAWQGTSRSRKPLGSSRMMMYAWLASHKGMISLRELQSETQEELDALLPSVPDRAFKGEL